MKPQRMRMTHELVSAYGMIDKMSILVNQVLFTSCVSGLTFSAKRAKRATGEQMTRFHTDEYVHFLQNVTPETCDKLSSHGTRCAQHYSCISVPPELTSAKFWLATTILRGMVSSSFVLCPPGGQ